ncbi:MAG: hypothetical protein FWD55_08925, partial [Propionibacteriaceae bacterium]|nr:hypothetical protein [Propionibacteriaceae bacterium]
SETGQRTVQLTIPNDDEGRLFLANQLRESGQGIEALMMLGLAEDPQQAQVLFDRAEGFAWLADQTNTPAWQEAVDVADRGLQRHNETLQRMIQGTSLDAPTARWEADLDANVFRWIGGTGTITSQVQMLGTRNPANDSWMWGWHHKEIPEDVQAGAQVMKAWGEKRGLQPLTRPVLFCRLSQARMFGNIAVGLGLGDFVYVAGGSPETYLLLHNIQITVN